VIIKPGPKKMENSNQPIFPIYKEPSFFWKTIDLLFPTFCCNCGVLGNELCQDCFRKIVILDQRNICPICGDISIRGFKCNRCQKEKPFFDQLRSWGVYSGVLKEVIQKIKFNHGLGLPSFFIDACVDFIKSWDIDIDIDMILPLPLSKTRLQSRGYNQAALIAKPIAKRLQIPYNLQAISRIRETKSQVGLSSPEREENVLGAFEGNPEIVQGKSVLVIDDITTTDSTLNECSKALKKAEAKKVFCFTLARTPFIKDHFEELEAK
jgi:competence protein ComFC